MKNIALKFSFITLLLLSTIFGFGCNTVAKKSNSNQSVEQPSLQQKMTSTDIPTGKKAAYFASGCFWCVEAIYDSVKGVENVVSGYSGGHTKNPTYESSNTGRTGHAEAVMVVYDPEVVSFSSLVDVYFGSQNPTQVNGQGPDNGSQYRSIIFYETEEEKTIIEEKKTALAKALNASIAAEVMLFEKFWVAEDYHQDYERLHPNQGYIRAVSIPRLNRFKKKFPELLKEKAKH